MSIDDIPILAVLLGTIGLVLVSLESGIRAGKRRRLSGHSKVEISGAMVGATMGLLAFMLAFTFNGAAARHETRKNLVVEEANAIEVSWLRAGFLPEPSRSRMRALLRDYTNIRLKAVSGDIGLAEGLRTSEAMHEEMWSVAQDAGQQSPTSVATGLFIASVNEVIDVHVRRMTVGLRYRVPFTIWVMLYALMALGMIMMGIQIGMSGARQFGIELALALSFSVVLFLIVDLDRPQRGFINVSQQAMLDLQARLKDR
jgi:hypothetical protein